MTIFHNDFVLKRNYSTKNGNIRRRIGLSRRRNALGNNMPDGVDVQALKIGRVVSYGSQRMVVVTDQEGDKRMYPCSFFQWTYIKGCAGRQRVENNVKIPSF